MNYKFNLLFLATASVFFSSVLKATESNIVGPFYGRQIMMDDDPVIPVSSPVGSSVPVTVPTVSDADGDVLSGWKYLWQKGDGSTWNDVDVEQDIAGAITAVPAFLATDKDIGQQVRVCLRAVAATGYPDTTKISDPRCSSAGNIVAPDTSPVVNNLSIKNLGTGGQIYDEFHPANTGSAIGHKFRGDYVFFDADGDLEGSSIYRWFRANDELGTNGLVEIGDGSIEYTLTALDIDKYIFFEVTPTSATGYNAVGVAQSANMLQRSANASWSDADKYCQSRGTRLPTKTELLSFYAVFPAGKVYTELGWPPAPPYSAYWTSEDGGSNYHLYVRLDNGYSDRTPDSTVGVNFVCIGRGGVDLSGHNPPVAKNLSIDGDLKDGEILTGNYDFHDDDGDSEGISTYQWYRSPNKNGSGKIKIAGATGTTYKLNDKVDAGYYILFEVTPVSNSRTSSVGRAELISTNSRLLSLSKIYSDVERRVIPNFSAATSYCDNLVESGYSDWTLPTSNDLYILYDNLPNNQVGTVLGWPTDNPWYYWTSDITGPNQHILVALINKVTGTFPSTGYSGVGGYVTCVR